MPGREMKWGWHLDLICRFLEDFRARKFRRGTINIPPRCMKSLIVNVFYPLWVWIQPDTETTYGGPGHQFLTISHNQKLATRDSMATRTVLQSGWFQKHWGNRVMMTYGQSEKTRYSLSGGGHRNIGSTDSNITGENADTVILDDPHSAEDAFSEKGIESAVFKYDNEISTRLNDRSKSGFMMIMQRLSELDMTGHWIKMYGLYHPEKNPGGVMHLVLPMEFELDELGKTPVNPAGEWGYVDPRSKALEPLWPEHISTVEIENEIRAHSGNRELDRDGYFYNGQYQQRPSPKGGGIFKKNWWRKWEHKKPPKCLHTFASWDTAFSEKDTNKAAFSACTIWGVFHQEDSPPGVNSLILLGAWWGQVSYPDLKEKALELQNEFEIDAQFIEKKASGISLIQDLQRAVRDARRIRIRSIVPDRDKVARAHAATSAFFSGSVFYPSKRRWANEVVDLVSKFPNGAPPCADLVDTLSQAVQYLQRGWWFSHPDDVDAPEAKPEPTDEWLEDNQEAMESECWYG